MWRSALQSVSKTKLSAHSKRIQRPYSNDSSSGSKTGKVIVGTIAVAGATFAGAIAYGKYDPKFRNTLEKNIPYIDYVYKWLQEAEQKTTSPSKSPPDEKIRDTTSLLKKKLEREKAAASEAQKLSGETKSKTAVPGADQNTESKKLNTQEVKPTETSVVLPESQESEIALNEKVINDLLKKLQANSDDAIKAYGNAIESVRKHTKSLYEALELSEGSDNDIVWKEANQANIQKQNAINSAQEKAASTKVVVEKLKVNLKKAAQSDQSHPLIKSGEESIQKVLQQLDKAEAEIVSVENEAKTATEYQKLVNASKEQFQKELQIVLPNYIHGVKDKAMTESDLNLLIAHAHRRIEQLQKQLAKQQVTEQLKVDEAKRLQRMRDESMTESKIEAELERRNVDLETAVTNRVASLKEKFELELRQQLHRQAAAHADHIQEVLKMQEAELERKYSLDLEEKLLHQKGVFISEVSGNMARLKGILAFLKAKSEFDVASKKAQTLWLACQSMNEKITNDSAGNLHPLGKDLAAIKIAADEDNEFVSSVLASIPCKAVSRGVYTSESLKQRFQDVKKVCRQVALIDENNDSLYRYFLSYLQSLLVVDTVSIPKAELEGKVAVDTSEWDVYDILSRISYSLKVDDLEQALRYANQLKGESKVVATDWVKELRLLLETRLAVKALLTHAAAVSVQAYH